MSSAYSFFKEVINNNNKTLLWVKWKGGHPREILFFYLHQDVEHESEWMLQTFCGCVKQKTPWCQSTSSLLCLISTNSAACHSFKKVMLGCNVDKLAFAYIQISRQLAQWTLFASVSWKKQLDTYLMYEKNISHYIMQYAIAESKETWIRPTAHQWSQWIHMNRQLSTNYT